MSGIVFTKNLDTFTRKYYVKPSNEIEPPSKVAHDIERVNVLSEMAEQLLYYDGLSFHIFGENIALAMLIKVFGVRGFENLIEQGAIEFTFNTPNVLYTVDNVEGMNPLAAGMRYTSKAHNDPEESVILGLNWLTDPLPQQVKRGIVKKATNVYKIPSDDIASNAVKFGSESYKNNLFGEFGLPNEKDISKLTLPEREKLCKLAQECVTLAILSELKYNTLDSFHIPHLINAELETLSKALHIKNATNKLFRIQNIPDFASLIKQGVIKIEHIPELRNNKSSIKFRRWLDTVLCNSDDETDIVKEYLNAIENTKGFFEKEPWRMMKTISVCAIPGTILSLIAGIPLGMSVGSLIGKTLEPAVDVGISILDEYVLGSILRGWSPRHYFTDVILPTIER